jgi:hypothetical protein
VRDALTHAVRRTDGHDEDTLTRLAQFLAKDSYKSSTTLSEILKIPYNVCGSAVYIRSNAISSDKTIHHHKNAQLPSASLSAFLSEGNVFLTLFF